MNKIIILDIETCLNNNDNLDEEKLLIMSSNISFGRSNLKEEKSIEEFTKALNKMKENRMLSPLTSRIACIGVKEYEGDSLVSVSEMSERNMLLTLNKSGIIDQSSIIVTYNGNNFDIPYLLYKYAEFDIEPPSIISTIFNQGRYSKYHIDLMQFLSKISLTDNLHNKFEFLSLRKWNKLLKIIDESIVDNFTPEYLNESFWTGKYDDIKLHNVYDLYICEGILRKFGKIILNTKQETSLYE